MRAEPIKTAIEKAGSVRALAEYVGGVTPQAVSQWKVVPVKHVYAISSLTGLSLHQVRGDVFREEAAIP